MIVLKEQCELHCMRIAGQIVAEVLDLVQQAVRPGVTTQSLNTLSEARIRERGAIPSFLGYPPGSRNPFPASICTSVNEMLVHGIPGARMLREGDILTVDVGAYYQGFHGDAAWTFAVGEITSQAQSLLAVGLESLAVGIAQAVPGHYVGDIAAAIQTHIEAHGYYTTRQYTGHGIGRHLHEAPQIPNYGIPGSGVALQPGMTLCIEPMVLIGTAKTRVLADRWTVISANKELTAHFEHTIVVVDGEPEILTRL